MTAVHVEIDSGRPRLELVGGNLAPRIISTDHRGAKVALVATTALLLGGDEVDLDIGVGPGAWLEIVETAGTVAYDAAGEESAWKVRATIAAGGLLLWHGEPLVVANGANTLRSSVFHLTDGAMLCVRDTVVLGRTKEPGGAVRIRNRIHRCGIPVLVEDLDLREPSEREFPGLIGSARVLDTVTLLGVPTPDHPRLIPGTRFELDEFAATRSSATRWSAAQPAGTVGRVLRQGLAGSPAADWWSSWSSAARAQHRGPKS